MSIPLDRLYHYIESVANEIYGNTVIYRFYPYGSKKIEDLTPLNELEIDTGFTYPHVYCNDQEPLNFDYYQNFGSGPIRNDSHLNNAFIKTSIDLPVSNLRLRYWDIYDQCILLHSEQNSVDLIKYQNNNFIPVYYWSHAIIARDWFRSAQHFSQHKNVKKTFLIYNRAWSGSREYRLKFSELLIKNNLVDHCVTTCNTVDPESKLHYSQHQYINSAFKVTKNLDNVFKSNTTSSCASADFNLLDYEQTNIEVVLETLFDDQRLHLTEKILRPIACGQPFMLAATCGSLQYLRDYGFRTFNGIIDETYDTIKDPAERLCALTDSMQSISKWTSYQTQENLLKLHEIANYNQQYFFSDTFFQLITNELKENLNYGLQLLINQNTSERYFNLRKLVSTDPELHQYIIGEPGSSVRKYHSHYVKSALKFKNKY